jgi:hypothetical protein
MLDDTHFNPECDFFNGQTVCRMMGKCGAKSFLENQISSGVSPEALLPYVGRFLARGCPNAPFIDIVELQEMQKRLKPG